MPRILICLLLLLFIITNASSQMVQLPHQYLTAETVNLKYPMNSMDIRAVGLGGAQAKKICLPVGGSSLF